MAVHLYPTYTFVKRRARNSERRSQCDEDFYVQRFEYIVILGNTT